jgi:hypothetical protein
VIALALIASLFTVSGQAREFAFTKPYRFTALDTLQAELVAGGFAVQRIACVADACTLYLDDAEAKNPSSTVAAHTWVDGAAMHAQLVQRIVTLAAKVKSGAATQAEKDEMLYRLVQLVVSDKF